MEMIKLDKGRKDCEDAMEDEKKVVKEDKNQMLVDISSKTLFDEVYKKQQKIIEDKEREIKKKKQEEQAAKLKE